jgi:hypothetical protein
VTEARWAIWDACACASEQVPVQMEQPKETPKDSIQIWSDARAAQHQSYRVTKLKKKPFGMKHEARMLGIDRHLITNDAAKGNRTKRVRWQPYNLANWRK